MPEVYDLTSDVIAYCWPQPVSVLHAGDLTTSSMVLAAVSYPWELERNSGTLSAWIQGIGLGECGCAQVRLWDARTGECLHTAQHHRENTSACAWFPDGQHFLTGGIDKRAPSPT